MRQKLISRPIRRTQLRSVLIAQHLDRLTKLVDENLQFGVGINGRPDLIRLIRAQFAQHKSG